MKKEKDFYQCKECGLHYEKEGLAKACYEFCSKHKACSLEITKQSVEQKQL